MSQNPDSSAAPDSSSQQFFWGRALAERPLAAGEVYDLLLISRLAALGAELDEAQRGALAELCAKYSGGLGASLTEAGIQPAEVAYHGLPWFPEADRAASVRDLLFNRGKLREEAALLFREDVDLATLRAQAPFHNGCGSAIWRGLAMVVYGLPPKGYGAYGDIPRSTRRLEDLTPDPNWVPEPAAEPKAPKAPRPPKPAPEPKAPRPPKPAPEPKAAAPAKAPKAREAAEAAASATSALAALAAGEGNGVVPVVFRLAIKVSAAAVRSYKEMEEQEREHRREAAAALALFQIRLRDRDQPPVPEAIAAAYPSDYLRRSVASADAGMEKFMLPPEELAGIPPLEELEDSLSRYWLTLVPGTKLDPAEFDVATRAFIRTYQWLKTKDPILRWVDYEDLLNLALQALTRHRADVAADQALLQDLVGLMQGHTGFSARYAMEKEVLSLTHALLQNL